MKTEFVLIRHAQSVWNAEGRWQGQGDPPLSRQGREQAQTLARQVIDESPALLVASDLARARETAEIVGRSLGLPVELEGRLRELDVGDWSGLHHAEVARRWPDALARFRAGDPEVQVGGGESRRELRARALAALECWAERAPGGCVAVVTHGGLLRTLLGGLELANAEWRRIALAALRSQSGAV
ncbi:MAG: histidine phosphatase family protein [Myxococcota bacterium]